MNTRSTYFNRRLCVAKPTTIARFPENWPECPGVQADADGVVRQGGLIVDPPVLCEPGKAYRVQLDLEAGTATITESAHGGSW